MKSMTLYAVLLAAGVLLVTQRGYAAEERIDCAELDFKVSGAAQPVECSVDRSEHDVEYQKMTALQDDAYAVVIYIKTGHKVAFKAFSLEEIANEFGFGAAAGDKGGYEDFSYGLFNKKDSTTESCIVFKRESMMMPQVHMAKRLTIGLVCPTTGDVRSETAVNFLKSLDVPI